MDNIHLGSVICSYNRRRHGAILLVRVPATIIRSACLGEARNIIPNLSMSYRLTAACIISTAQQARPNVKGHRDPARAQVISDSTLDDNHSNFIMYNCFYLRKHLRIWLLKPLGRLTPYTERRLRFPTTGEKS